MLSNVSPPCRHYDFPFLLWKLLCLCPAEGLSGCWFGLYRIPSKSSGSLCSWTGCLDEAIGPQSVFLTVASLLENSSSSGSGVWFSNTSFSRKGALRLYSSCDWEGLSFSPHPPHLPVFCGCRDGQLRRRESAKSGMTLGSKCKHAVGRHKARVSQQGGGWNRVSVARVCACHRTGPCSA